MTSLPRRRVRAVAARLAQFITVVSLATGSLLVVGATPAAAEPGGYTDCTQLPDNLFKNCGFNQSLSGWAFDLPSTSIGISSAHSGSSSLAFQAYPDAPAGHSMSQSVTAPVAGTYRLGLWIRPVFAGTSDILAAVDDAAAVQIVPGGAPFNSWTYYSLDLLLPAGLSTVHLDIPSGGQPRFDLLDDFSLRALIPAFAVAYAANGGAGSMSAGGYQEGGAPYVLADNTFIRPGYTFAGWNTAANGSGTYYAPRASVTPSSALTLYAQWIPNSYGVSYEANGGTGSAAPGSYTTGDPAYVLAVDGFSRSGYSFDGWNTASDGSGTYYAPGASVTPSSALTLYAQWIPNSYVISYDGNSPTDVGDLPLNALATGGTPYVVGGSAGLSRTGYRFTAWNTEADGTGDSYQPGEAISPTRSLTLYAQWTANTYAISYDSNGGTGTTGGCTYTVGDGPCLVAENGFVRPGYAFAGWNTRSDGSGVNWASGAGIYPSAALTLYAQWTANTYAISYDANGGTGTTGACTYTVGDGPCLVAENGFVRPGYAFAGWNTRSDGSGVNYTSGAGIYPSTTMTLYAQWTANTYAISYAANAPKDEIEGEVPAGGSYTAGGSGYVVAAPDEDFFRDGYAFTAWNTKADGTGTSYLPGEALTTEQDVALYAQWRIATGVGLLISSSTQVYRTTDPQTLMAFAGVGTEASTSGIIRFRHGKELIGTVRLNEEGFAAMRVPTNLPLGKTSFTAEFTPTSRDLQPAVSEPADLTIARVSTSTQVTLRQQSLSAADQKKFKVRSALSVSVQVVGGGTRTAAAGTVAINVGGKVTTLTLTNGRAKTALVPTSAGLKKVVATYRPSTDFWVRSTGRAEITVR